MQHFTGEYFDGFTDRRNRVPCPACGERDRVRGAAAPYRATMPIQNIWWSPTSTSYLRT
jgi:hypothetical protein